MRAFPASESETNSQMVNPVSSLHGELWGVSQLAFPCGTLGTPSSQITTLLPNHQLQ